ncbi:hypothetical protein ACEPAI_614 [Sanghuangporus weigelae]
MENTKGAFATLLSRPSYLPGTVVLDYSLKQVRSKYPLVVMVSTELPKECLDVLSLRDIKTVPISRLAPKIQSTAVTDERFPDTWCKLAVFQLTHFERVVLIDSDMIIRKNMDEIFDMPLDRDWIAAAHVCACNPRRLPHYPRDWTPENCAFSSPVQPAEIKEGCPRPYTLLNSGTVVVTPSTGTFQAIVRFLETSPLVSEFQFPDQDLLAEFFRAKWKPISYIYNALKTVRIIHKDMWCDEDVKCVHYILGDKPWKHRPKEGEPLQNDHHELNQWWWDAYYGLEKEMKNAGSEDSKRAWEYIEQHVAS